MNVALTAGVVMLLATLYAKRAGGLASEWMWSPDASYGVLLAGVAAAVAWQRRRMFVAAADSHARAFGGLALLIVGAVMYLAGVLGADVFITRISAVPVTAGAVWYLCGP